MKPVVILLLVFSFSSYAGEIKSQKAPICGGIAGVTCAKGFICKLDGNYPDAQGSCVKAVIKKQKRKKTTDK